MGEAAALLNSFSPDIIDINMGCPVKKVTKRGAGAALMTDIVNAEQIIRSVVASAGCPVTVKFRSGPDLRTINVTEFVRMSEAQGVSAITVHGRTWSQGFSGAADWQIIAEVKRTSSIPVIGNGDICTYADAMQRMAQSGCDGVMIGRAALGNPWVFNPGDKPKTLQGVLQGASRHLCLIEKYTATPFHTIASIKNHLGRYFRGLRGSSAIRRRIYETKSWGSLRGLLDAISQENTT
jgi:nifR3 family TIM-barrel protein